MAIKSAFIGATLALTALTSGAQAAVVTFEAIPFGPVTTSYSEAGFTISEASGALFGSNVGNPNPGGNLEGQFDGGGVARIVATNSSLFTFRGLDYAAGGSQTLTVLGFLEGVQVGLATYDLTNSQAYPFTNWTTFGAGGLAGRKVDTLFIGLNATQLGERQFLIQGIDNIQLGGVPEPGVWAMMIIGLGGVGAMLRRRRGLALAG